MIVVAELAPDQADSVGLALPLNRLTGPLEENATYLIAWEREEPVGHAHIAWRGTRLGAPEIQDVFVLPQWRRRGVASCLTAAAEDMARQRGWSRISLSVSRSGNPAARVLYDRLGYSDAGEPPVHVTGHVQLRTGVLDVDDVLIYLQKEL